ncbi:MAG: hypothetical protein WC465_03575 [Patescibacteria group bacterium]
MVSAKHKLIFEGAELSGKSFVMSQVYNFLEPKYNSGGRILDGCHWFNCDVGLFGTAFGQATLNKYVEIFEELSGLNLLIEKFHISEAVYQQIYNNQAFDFSIIEKRLASLGAKIILTTFAEDEELIKKRLQDRINLYPHYQRVAQEPRAYLHQQTVFLDLLKKSSLPVLLLDSSVLPNPKIIGEILHFIGEQ